MTLLSPLSFLAVLCIGLFFGTYVAVTFQLQQLYHRLLTSRKFEIANNKIFE